MAEEKDYGLAGVHAKLIEALDTFDTLCRSNGIRYSLHGGTLLGAVRDHRIIPWDHDADVSMMRAEYRKLEALCGQGDWSITLRNAWTSRFVTKCSTGTTISIDVFIWDYISSNRLGQILKINLLRAVQGMMKDGTEPKKKSAVHRFLLWITDVVGKLFSLEKKQRLYRYISENVLTGKKEYIHRSNDSFRGCSYVLDSGYMGEYTDILLEGRPYMVNLRHVEFLKMEYGDDYLTPIPGFKRTSLHRQAQDCVEKKGAGA